MQQRFQRPKGSIGNAADRTEIATDSDPVGGYFFDQGDF